MQGDDYDAVVTLWSQGRPVDLTGFTAPQAQLREGIADEQPVAVDFTCSIDADPTTGKVRMALDRADTVALTPGESYYWDLQITDADGRLRTFVRPQNAVVEAEVTRP